VGLSTDQGVRFQGFHGRVLIVVDEAPGVKADIWEAIEGIRAGGDVRVLALGNPTIASGPFHDAFTSNRDGWGHVHDLGVRQPEPRRANPRRPARPTRCRARPLPASLPRHPPVGAREVRRVGARASALGSARPRPVPYSGGGCVDLARLAGGRLLDVPPLTAEAGSRLAWTSLGRARTKRCS
jgi:hypothetical protein